MKKLIDLHLRLTNNKLTTINDYKADEAVNNKSGLTWEKLWNNVNLNALSFWKKDSALAVGPEGVIAEIKYLAKKCK
ncbi:hypothetical protein ACQUW5_00010 [Legionella sp. CNM-1927-20]|uniref:hypothetical protein n=1 Tax=Legionella sp. CNM-1927-20 TaxID=3422221 RepID=UPI00403A8537